VVRPALGTVIVMGLVLVKESRAEDSLVPGMSGSPPAYSVSLAADAEAAALPPSAAARSTAVQIVLSLGISNTSVVGPSFEQFAHRVRRTASLRGEPDGVWAVLDAR